jgi:hypothetical protein
MTPERNDYHMLQESASHARSEVPPALVDVRTSEGSLCRPGVQQAALNATGIVFADNIVLCEDVAGFEDAGGSLLHVHAYPKREPACVGNRSRYYARAVIDFSASPQVKGAWLAKYKRLWDRDKLQRLLVVLSPFSGGKRGQEVWFKEVEPVLRQSGILVDLVITTHPGHAVTIGRSANLPTLNGIIAMGGDGTLSEVIQGLLSRSDAEASFLASFPVGVIPTGTGNGFAASHLFPAGEECSPVCAALCIARARIQRTDIALVLQNDQTLYRCMLSWAWGLVRHASVKYVC